MCDICIWRKHAIDIIDVINIYIYIYIYIYYDVQFLSGIYKLYGSFQTCHWKTSHFQTWQSSWTSSCLAWTNRPLTYHGLKTSHCLATSGTMSSKRRRTWREETISRGQHHLWVVVLGWVGRWYSSFLSSLMSSGLFIGWLVRTRPQRWSSMGVPHLSTARRQQVTHGHIAATVSNLVQVCSLLLPFTYCMSTWLWTVVDICVHICIMYQLQLWRMFPRQT